VLFKVNEILWHHLEEEVNFKVSHGLDYKPIIMGEKEE
jgi:hypothetical protein